MQYKVKNPLLWISLVILLLIFIGIMIENHHRKDEALIRLNTSASVLHEDIDRLLAHARKLPIETVAYPKAYRSFTSGDFKQSYRQILPYALGGNVKAILVIGFMYEFGQGVKKDMKTAALWYYLGIRQNQYNKLVILRGIHAYNNGNYPLAAQWFRMADELTIDQG